MIHLRDATEADAFQIGELHAESWRHAYAGMVHDEFLQSQNALGRSEQALTRILSGATRTIVAELNRQIIGFAEVGPSRNPEIAQAQLHAIYLHPQFIGKGMGTQLFKKSLQIAVEYPYRTLFASVLSENHRAINFYKKMGGRLVGHDCVVIEKIRYETDTFWWRLETLQSQFSVKERTSETLSEINSFYKMAGYSGEAKENDQVFLAVCPEKIAGVVRIALEENSLILRGMYVDSSLRGSGIGRKMLIAVQSHLDSFSRPCYAIPYDHLINFYGMIGFKSASLSEAPSFLAERFDDYQRRGLKVTLIKREPLLK